jgi:hypothetical protein
MLPGSVATTGKRLAKASRTLLPSPLIREVIKKRSISARISGVSRRNPVRTRSLTKPFCRMFVSIARRSCPLSNEEKQCLTSKPFRLYTQVRQSFSWLIAEILVIIEWSLGTSNSQRRVPDSFVCKQRATSTPRWTVTHRSGQRTVAAITSRTLFETHVIRRTLEWLNFKREGALFFIV